MAAFWYTYAIPLWEIEEGEELEEEEKQHQEMMRKEVKKSMYEEWRDLQLQDLYDDMARCGSMLKFYYKPPSLTLEAMWRSPNFIARDPLGLFCRYVDDSTFHILYKDIFKMKDTVYHATGHFHLSYFELKSLFLYAEDWCEINLMYEDGTESHITRKNYKVTVWIVSRMIEYLSR